MICPFARSPLLCFLCTCSSGTSHKAVEAGPCPLHPWGMGCSSAGPTPGSLNRFCPLLWLSPHHTLLFSSLLPGNSSSIPKPVPPCLILTCWHPALLLFILWPFSGELTRSVSFITTHKPTPPKSAPLSLTAFLSARSVWPCAHSAHALRWLTGTSSPHASHGYIVFPPHSTFLLWHFLLQWRNSHLYCPHNEVTGVVT